MDRKKSIEYSELNWNPYTGCLNWNMENGICGLGKDCWAYGMAQRLRGRYGYNPTNPFKPTIHQDKLDVPLDRKKPTIYATCFMGDIGYCPDSYLRTIINIIKLCPQHTFIMLTKMPHLPLFRIRSFPDNIWLGTTITGKTELYRIDDLKSIDCKHKWVSFEPLCERIQPNLEGIEGIAIGGKTGPHPYQPKDSHIKELLIYARSYDCKVVLKDNLDFGPKIIEWP